MSLPRKRDSLYAHLRQIPLAIRVYNKRQREGRKKREEEGEEEQSRNNVT